MNAFTRATDALTAVLPFRTTRAKSAPRVSPLALVDPRASIGENVEVGPFCIIGPDVTLGAGNKLVSHVVITGHTTVGSNNVFHPNCVIGDNPQDLKFKGETCHLEIGDENVFREAVTIHVGTKPGGGVTRIGSNNLLMVNAHVGHDVTLGNRCILANNVMIAGHIVIGNNVVLNGAVGIGAFVTIGDFAYIAGASRIHHDVPPFMKVSDDDRVRGLNAIGLRRGGVSEDDISALEEASRLLFSRRTPQAQAMQELASRNGHHPRITQVLEFLRRRDSGKHGRYLEGLRR
jgi:UDP-N-acetylglucosamine acyltransferase